MFEEAVYGVKFLALRSSPTVAHELAITTAYEKSLAIFRRVSEGFLRQQPLCNWLKRKKYDGGVSRIAGFMRH
jgi:hypothetical protein